MTKRNLTLIGQRRRQPNQRSKRSPLSPLQPPVSHIPPFLTSAERVEGARFKVLTIERAARQARIRQMSARLQDLDNAA
ncbi:MAG TPA: hypothetical protein P5526_08445 [Anaerolineae bacterium]|nr:hypothetical protein [Anaerolineae bacterium]MCB0177440.1 hypothetical protein [Anaerolineae bacterium]MCB9078967.1 hypothetical protein [Anaerolineaceae bacterium]MCB9107242.1 hypothetical protein [Anaerolineales bacterium]HRV92177.1 hypothetical protein [Anaerolineae bacterium]